MSAQSSKHNEWNRTANRSLIIISMLPNSWVGLRSWIHSRNPFFYFLVVVAPTAYAFMAKQVHRSTQNARHKSSAETLPTSLSTSCPTTTIIWVFHSIFPNSTILSRVTTTRRTTLQLRERIAFICVATQNERKRKISLAHSKIEYIYYYDYYLLFSLKAIYSLSQRQQVTIPLINILNILPMYIFLYMEQKLFFFLQSRRLRSSRYDICVCCV